MQSCSILRGFDQLPGWVYIFKFGNVCLNQDCGGITRQILASFLTVPGQLEQVRT